MPSFIGDVVSGVADAVGGAVDAIGEIAAPVASIASFVPGPWQIPAIAFNGVNALANGNVLGAAGSAFGLSNMGGFGGLFGNTGGVVYDASGMAVDAASVASGAVELAGGKAFDAIGNVLGDAVEVANKVASGGGGFSSTINSIFGNPSSSIMPGESGGVPTSMGGSTFGIPNSQIKNILGAGSAIYNAFNAPDIQAPRIAQAGADPYAPYRADAAAKLNDLIANPNKVYGQPGYQFAQQQGAKQIERAAAATGNLASGHTLSALQEQGAQTAQSWYDNYVKNLSVLSGAANNPASGQNAYNVAQEAKNKAEADQQKNLLMGIQGLATSFFG